MAGPTRYQRVTTASDYDTVGFPYYLAFDGIDDFLTTAAIDLTGTSQVAAFAGFAQSAAGDFAPMYGNGSAATPTQGTFAVFATSNTVNDGRFDFGGVASINFIATELLSGATYVTSQLLSSTSSPYQEIRKNGASVGTSATAVGGQPFANAAFSIANQTYLNGNRKFAGKMYGLVCLGRTATAAEITATEAYIASKSGVTL